MAQGTVKAANPDHEISVAEAKNVTEHMKKNSFDNIKEVVVYGPHDFRGVAATFLRIKGSKESADALAESYSDTIVESSFVYCGSDDGEHLYGTVDPGTEYKNFAGESVWG